MMALIKMSFWKTFFAIALGCIAAYVICTGALFLYRLLLFMYASKHHELYEVRFVTTDGDEVQRFLSAKSLRDAVQKSIIGYDVQELTGSVRYSFDDDSTEGGD